MQKYSKKELNKMPYKIPLMSIQDCLLNFHIMQKTENKEWEDLKSVVYSFCNNSSDFNYDDGDYQEWDFELEARWYPVLITNNKWLAKQVLKQMS